MERAATKRSRSRSAQRPRKRARGSPSAAAAAAAGAAAPPLAYDRLVFYSSSADAPPGAGAEEHLAHPAAYAALAAVPHWRRMLSNFDASAPFVYRGRTYRSIEHAFQAAKIALADDALAASFALESHSALAHGGGDAARAARKLAVLSKAQLGEWAAQSGEVMAGVARAKYTAAQAAPAGSAARRPLDVLLATGDAQLWHFVARAPRGRNLVHFVHLETIRRDARSAACVIT